MTTRAGSPTATRFKLGLFTLIAIAAVAAVVMVLGMPRQATDIYHTYFDETVHGLEIGAPVKFRGVRVGSVKAIDVAPDRLLVDVSLAIDRDAADRLDLDHAASKLRARLALQGITGLKLVDLEIATPGSPPPPELTFTPPAHYIPSRPSLTATLTDRLEAVGNQLPDLVERTSAVLAMVEQFGTEVASHRLPARLGALIDDAQSTVRELRTAVNGIGRADLTSRLARSLDHLDKALARLDGDNGLFASAQRTSEVIADVGRSTRGSSEDLARAIRDVGDAARAMRGFFDMVERQPDVLFKGRPKEPR
jgi:ABC-type transporter Mla subunit MlaD